MNGAQPHGASVTGVPAESVVERSAVLRAWPAPPRVGRLAAAIIAVAAPLVAFGLGMLLRPSVYSVPFVLFFLSTAFTAWSAGLWPAAFATVAGGFLGAVYFMPPYGELALTREGVIGSLLFILVGTVTTFLAASVRHHAQERAVVAARAEEARDGARATQAQIESILLHITDGVTVQRRDGSLLFTNDAAARLAGFSSSEAMMSRHGEILRRYEIFDEDDRPFPLEMLPGRRAIAGHGTSTVLLKVRDVASGELRWTQVTAAPVGDGAQPELAVNVMRDVTARQRDDDRQRFAAEAASALASSLDLASTLRAVAELAVRRLADWCAIDLVGPDGGPVRLATMHKDPAKVALAAELARDYPPDRDAPRGVPQVIRSGKPELYTEIPDELLAAAARDPEHLRRIREIGMRSAICVPIVGRERTLGAITLVASESGRRYGAGDLEFAVELGARAGLALENARLYADALEALRVRDAFIAVAGHELRTPLTALLLQVQGMQLLVAKRKDDPELAKLAARLDKSENNVRRLDRLVRELLDVSRIAAGRLALTPEELDLVELTKEVAERHRPPSGTPAIAVDAVGALVGRWDRMRLDQVLTNLLSNALKYGDGKPISVAVARDGERAVLRVHDRGIGIAPDDLARVFERFERAVPEKRYAGMGLGLWITRAIVAAHGGTIHAASAPGEGTTFTVELPLDVTEHA